MSSVMLIFCNLQGETKNKIKILLHKEKTADLWNANLYCFEPKIISNSTIKKY